MPNEDQIEYWNGEASTKWVTRSSDLDAMLAPFIDAILSEAGPQPGEVVLDIGCGAGALSLAAAGRVGPTGSVTGIDVSRPLLDLARQRASAMAQPVSFEEADASIYRAGQPVDCAISRFGVMFFDDPEGAFASLRRNLRPEGRMVFACWQAPEHNEWATLPLRLALPFLDTPLERPPEGSPGPFAFDDAERVRAILEGGGWKGVQMNPWQGAMTLPGASPEETAAFMLGLGPMSRLLAGNDVVLDKVRDELCQTLGERRSEEGTVRLGASAWIVSATAS